MAIPSQGMGELSERRRGFLAGEKVQMHVSKTPAQSLSLSSPSWELLPFGKAAPSAAHLKHQLSFCASLQGIKTGHCGEAAARGWKRTGPIPCLHLLL